MGSHHSVIINKLYLQYAKGTLIPQFWRNTVLNKLFRYVEIACEDRPLHCLAYSSIYYWEKSDINSLLNDHHMLLSCVWIQHQYGEGRPLHCVLYCLLYCWKKPDLDSLFVLCMNSVSLRWKQATTLLTVLTIILYRETWS